jgi:hypothetical protein
VNISDALYVGITDNRYRPDSEATDAPGIIADIRAEFPSEVAAARFAGVPRSSWRRWVRGARPTARAFAALQSAQRRVRLPREREKWMRHGHIVVRGILAFSDDTTPFKRLVTGWPKIPNAMPDEQSAGMQSRILDAWLSADDLRAVDMLMRPLHAGLNYHAGHDIRIHVVDITSIGWYRTRGEAMQAMRLKEM